MAWTEQCRVAFKTNADALLYQQEGKRNLHKVLRELSKDSDVPFATLKRWWYEEERTKNDTLNKVSIKSTTKAQKSPKPSGLKPETERPVCELCKKKPVERKKRKSGTWYHYNRCVKCRKITQPAYEKKANIKVLCPHCGQNFKLKKGDLNYE